MNATDDDFGVVVLFSKRFEIRFCPETRTLEAWRKPAKWNVGADIDGQYPGFRELDQITCVESDEASEIGDAIDEWDAKNNTWKDGRQLLMFPGGGLRWVPS